eukprot:TRINITY_DN23604_c0_g1_i1.p1 TRINITY_DN23604_c0_g1~~TRINITY_DN23604_c0_g1_i1.p1  ORF type:complete len:339 (+),score=24.25 TRINITY_DN23604_c0_g1_i1:291-1307(+)
MGSGASWMSPLPSLTFYAHLICKEKQTYLFSSGDITKVTATNVVDGIHASETVDGYFDYDSRGFFGTSGGKSFVLGSNTLPCSKLDITLNVMVKMTPEKIANVKRNAEAFLRQHYNPQEFQALFGAYNECGRTGHFRQGLTRQLLDRGYTTQQVDEMVLMLMPSVRSVKDSVMSTKKSLSELRNRGVSDIDLDVLMRLVHASDTRERTVTELFSLMGPCFKSLHAARVLKDFAHLDALQQYSLNAGLGGIEGLYRAASGTAQNVTVITDKDQTLAFELMQSCVELDFNKHPTKTRSAISAPFCFPGKQSLLVLRLKKDNAYIGGDITGFQFAVYFKKA